MHELAVTQSLLELALRHADEARAQHITDLYLVIGQLSSIVDDSVAFYWDMISQGTIAQGARLHFRRIPAELLCDDCGRRYLMGDELSICPACASGEVRVVNGDQFLLEAIDIDK